MLEARQLAFRYHSQKTPVFSGLDLNLAPGEIVGLPGPSGRGKSTAAKALAGYLLPTAGKVLLDGQPLPTRGFCPAQLLFQHPELAVNPRWPIRQILREAEEPPESLLEELEIKPAWLDRYPHELSGGELQRVCLARALGGGTKYLLCDEITSMLDALTQAHIWQTLLRLAGQRRLGLLVISHDRKLVGRLCQRIISCFEAD